MKRLHNASERGWALASVLWAVTMLSLMAAATQELALTAHRSESRALEGAAAQAALHAAIVQAIVGITAPDVSVRWRVDGTPKKLTFGGVTLRVAVQDESGRYDLNAVDSGALSALLRGHGLAPDKVTALANSILDWRSAPGPHRLEAATDDDYQSAGLPYHPRHGPFQSVEELRLVLGIDNRLFAAIRPALTVSSKRGSIDPAIAPAEALLAYFNADTDRVAAALKARDAGDDSGLLIYPDAHKGVLNAGVSLVGRRFDIIATMEIGSRVYRYETIVMLTGDAKEPILTLWSAS